MPLLPQLVVQLAQLLQEAHVGLHLAVAPHQGEGLRGKKVEFDFLFYALVTFAPNRRVRQ